MWDANTGGVLELPSSSLIRGRALRDPIPVGPQPDFGLYLQGRDPGEFDWDSGWVRWPDFWLPSDSGTLDVVLREALRRCVTERAEIACTGGVGRTGTALACLVALDGVPGNAAVDYVRSRYAPRGRGDALAKAFCEDFRQARSSALSRIIDLPEIRG